MVTNDDIRRRSIRVAESTAPPTTIGSCSSEAEIAQLIDFLMRGFNPEANEIDRRIYYEVTGRQLNEDEFDDVDTSDDEWGSVYKPDPLAHAFDYREEEPPPIGGGKAATSAGDGGTEEDNGSESEDGKSPLIAK